ncbi:cell wall-binding repeat-containing protein [Agromyces sp. Soil535]|uniref:cell wall-binding repeat-containing protein n=1 Tax=Agromyces sp. Soil535 TaxID=1736390 RepID=UPI00138F32AA|nr:cell wall-binding repeat-containing protein [Agromyces sp. Soil535]
MTAFATALLTTFSLLITTAAAQAQDEAVGDTSLSGTVVALGSDGHVLEERRYAQVSVHGLDDDHWETKSGSPFTFDGLTAGNRYVVAAHQQSPYAGAFAGGSPDEGHAQVFTATTAGIRIEQPVGALATGSIRYLGGWLEQGLSVTAYRVDPDTGRYQLADFAEDEGGRYTFDALYPGTYVFQGREDWHIDGPIAGDVFWSGADDVDHAVPVTLSSGESRTGLDLELESFRFTTSRVAGRDRYETAVLATRRAFPNSVPVLYIASGANWPDALSAGPAASKRGGALLLTDPARLPDVVRDEVARLAPAEVVVVGSAKSVSDQVMDQLRSLAPVVRRIGGSDRYETSRLIVQDAFGPGPHPDAYLATGTNFPDALSAAPLAGSVSSPVILVYGPAKTLDPASKALLSALRPRATEIIGGFPSVSFELEQDLIASGAVEYVRPRDAGQDRYATSERLSRRISSGAEATAYLATGTGFADALGAATAAVTQHASIVLTPAHCVRSSALDGFKASYVDRLVVLGGETTLGSGVEQLAVCP